MAQYTFRGRCEEDPEIAFDDGEERIFYNCCYQGEDIPDELRKLYDYIETGKSSSNLTDRIDNAVEEARKVEEWRSGYMKEMALFMDAKDEGKAEGKAEGICIFIEDKRDDGIGDDIIKQKLMTRFKLTDREADEFLKKTEEKTAVTG